MAGANPAGRTKGLVLRSSESLDRQRIVSLLPAATEMIYALGIGERLVGVSHECDFPLDARSKTVISRPTIELAGLTLAQIDRAITECLGKGESIYKIDERLLRDACPDLMVTQDLCQVCAPSGNELNIALQSLATFPEVVFMSPHSIREIEQNMFDLGAATGREESARTIVASGRERFKRLAERMRTVATHPRVFCAEWVDPIFCCGHWVPQMIELAGGIDALGKRGANSVRISWDDVVRWAPDVLIVAPCGFHTDRALQQISLLQLLPGYSDLPAVRAGRVYAVDANSYFARPGPRVIEGTELLAHLIHPEIFEWHGSGNAFAHISRSAGPERSGAKAAFLGK